MNYKNSCATNLLVVCLSHERIDKGRRTNYAIFMEVRKAFS